MARYVDTHALPEVALGTTGAAGATKIPNNGVTFVAGTTAEVYVLEAPVAGCQKRICFVTSTSTGLVHTVRGSSGQTITFSGGAMGDNTALPTMFKLAATRSTNQAVTVDLMGYSSVSWIITNVHPTMTTGIGGGSITLSTT